jgi:hypothetical protein
MSLATQTHQCSTVITTARNSSRSFAEGASSLLAQSRHTAHRLGRALSPGFDNNQFLFSQLVR